MDSTTWGYRAKRLARDFGDLSKSGPDSGRWLDSAQTLVDEMGLALYWYRKCLGLEAAADEEGDDIHRRAVANMFALRVAQAIVNHPFYAPGHETESSIVDTIASIARSIVGLEEYSGCFARIDGVNVAVFWSGNRIAGRPSTRAELTEDREGRRRFQSMVTNTNKLNRAQWGK